MFRIAAFLGRQAINSTLLRTVPCTTMFFPLSTQPAHPVRRKEANSAAGSLVPPLAVPRSSTLSWERAEIET